MTRASLAILFSSLALCSHARADSSVVVSAELKSAMHGYMVYVDGSGVQDASNQPKRFPQIAAGRHEVQVDLWTSPWKLQGTMQCKGLVKVPRDSELRVKCGLSGKLETIGASQNEPKPIYALPTEVPRGYDAADLLASAARRMRGTAGPCGRMSLDVRDLREDLDERRRGRHGRHRLAREAAEFAEDARDVCPRVVTRLLLDASLALGSYGDDEVDDALFLR